MKAGAYFQCCNCGAVHYIEYSYKKEDLYNTFWCGECEDEVKHLWVGDNIEDKYLYYNPCLDERFFIYD